MPELHVILLIFVVEAVLVAAAVAGLMLWRRTPPSAVAPGPGPAPQLTTPDELAAEVRAYLEFELEKNHAALAAAAGARRAALAQRQAALEAELAGLALADRPELFWDHVETCYGAKAAEPSVAPHVASVAEQ